MPVGLQCWDEYGREVFNTNTRTLRFVKTIVAPINAWTGRVYNSAIHKNCILSAYRTNRGYVAPVGLIAGDGFATYIAAYGGGSLTINIYEY